MYELVDLLLMLIRIFFICCSVMTYKKTSFPSQRSNLNPHKIFSQRMVVAKVYFETSFTSMAQGFIARVTI